MTKLLDSKQMATDLDPSGQAITPATLIRWRRERKIPGVKLGHRSVFFDPSAVRKALEKFQILEAGAGR